MNKNSRFNNLDTVKRLSNMMVFLRPLAYISGQHKIFNEANKSMKEVKINCDLVDSFNNNFIENGWMYNEILDNETLKEVMELCNDHKKSEAEKLIVDFYSNRSEFFIKTLYCNEEIRNRIELIELAFLDHKEGRFHSSVPSLLMIVDGAVNDFAVKSNPSNPKGLFSEGSDYDVWDSFAVCNDELKRLKDVIFKSRKKTNKEGLTIPYRNGILHGRDLNYANEMVSSKCISLLFTISSWMKDKSSEEDRRNKFIKETSIPTKEEIEKIKKHREELNDICKNWSKRRVIVGKDISPSGNVNEYEEYPYLKPLVEMFELWDKKRYGDLAEILDSQFKYEENKKLRKRECNHFYRDKILKNFEILQVEETGVFMSKIVVKVTWINKDRELNAELAYNIVYQNNKYEGIEAKSFDNHRWTIIPINITSLRNLN